MLRFIPIIASVATSFTVITSPPSQIEGDFANSSVCSLPYPCNSSIAWLHSSDIPSSSLDDTVYSLYSSTPLGSDWNDFVENGDWSDVTDGEPIWFGERYDCSNWTATEQCGGGQITYPNGTKDSVSCSSTHRLICICFGVTQARFPTRSPTDYVPTASPSTSIPTITPTISPTAAAPTSMPSTSSPTFDVARAVSFAMGYYSTCVLFDSNDVYCHGEPQGGLFWADDITPYPHYAYLPPVKKIVGGATSFVAQLANDSWVHFGTFRNEYPFPPTAEGMPNVTLLQDLPSNVTKMTVSVFTVTALLDNGEVYSTGDNYLGSFFGNNGSSPGLNMTHFERTLVGPAKDIAGAFYSVCALLIDGTVWCWGMNFYGVRGDGSESHVDPNIPGINPLPTKVQNLTSEVVKLCGTGVHHCALMQDSKIMCWGSNFAGESGLPSTGEYEVTALLYPIHADIWDPYVNVSQDLICGSGFTCLHLNNGSYACMGRIEYNGIYMDELPRVPAVLSRLDGLVNVSKTNLDSLCGFNATGYLLCFGQNIFLNLGEQTNSSTVYVPMLMPEIEQTCVFGGGVCAVFSDTMIPTCTNEFNVNYLYNHLAPVVRIHCGTEHVVLQYAEEFVTFYPDTGEFGNVNFTIPLGGVTEVTFSPQTTPIVLGTNGIMYYYNISSSAPLTLLNASSLHHLSSFGDAVCIANATHVSRNSSTSTFPLSKIVSKIVCGPTNEIAWIYEDGEMEMMPSNPFDVVVDDVIDVAFSSNAVCALSDSSVLECHSLNIGFASVYSNEALPIVVTRLVTGGEHMCLEGQRGDAWCFSGAPGFVYPLRVNATRV